jgi:hypothetical protein
MISRNIVCYGKPVSPPDVVELRAGPFILDFQGGEISNIRFQGFEVVQRIYSRVRDGNWGTAPNNIKSLTINKGDKAFDILFNVDSIQEKINFAWEGSIRGSTEGKIEFSFSGRARSDFLTSRIGFCILHPLSTCMGKPCWITDQTGQPKKGFFPRYIAPAEIPPFLDMQSLEYEICPGFRTRLSFEGDLFEMEDQRNWTDASYKTFCTPLRFKSPRLVKIGTEISQKVTLELLADNPVPSITSFELAQEFISISLNQDQTKAMPGIGLSSPAVPHQYTNKEIQRLTNLGLSHLRLVFRSATFLNEQLLRNELKNARSLNVPLEIVLNLKEFNSDIRHALRQIRDMNCPVARWIIFEEGRYVSSRKSLQAFRKLAGNENSIPIGGGSAADFYELNNQVTSFDFLDFICFSMNPQVHSTDDSAIIENLPAQAMCVESALQMSCQKPVIISPITLKPRFNPVATTAVIETDENTLPTSVDPRQMSLFAAGWLIGSLHYLLHSQISSLTYFETVGWKGVMENENGSPMPMKFQSIPGGVFPLYHVLADVGQFKPGVLFETTSSAPMKVPCLGIKGKGQTQLLFANLTQQSRTIIFKGLGEASRLRLMDETNALSAMTDPENFRSGINDIRIEGKSARVELMPFAFGRLITY